MDSKIGSCRAFSEWKPAFESTENAEILLDTEGDDTSGGGLVDDLQTPTLSLGSLQAKIVENTKNEASSLGSKDLVVSVGDWTRTFPACLGNIQFQTQTPDDSALITVIRERNNIKVSFFDPSGSGDDGPIEVLSFHQSKRGDVTTRVATESSAYAEEDVRFETSTSSKSTAKNAR